MAKRKIVQWIGYGISLISNMLCGLALGFNVYAVQLKELFRFSQTKVELLGSFTVTGWCFVIVGGYIYNRYGYKVAYVLANSLMTSSCLLMALATCYVPFFRTWTALLCLFLFMFTAGAGLGIMCCTAIGVQMFSTKHTGKVISLYMAACGLGKMYYSALYELFFQQQELLGGFFVTVGVCIAVGFSGCALLHKPVESSHLPDSDNVDEHEPIVGNSDKHKNTLLKSPHFWLVGFVAIFFHATLLTFMNNVTGIAESTGVEQSLTAVYVLAVIIVTSRLIFGTIYDCLGSQTGGTVLLLFCQTSFVLAMLIGLFSLNKRTLYGMVSLGAIACGPGYSLPLAMMTSAFGAANYPSIMGFVDGGIGVINILIHIASGMTYDSWVNPEASGVLFCKECFFWIFIILMSSAVFSSLLLIVNLIIHRCYRSSPGDN